MFFCLKKIMTRDNILRTISIALLSSMSSNSVSASHHPTDFLKSISGSPSEGSQIVQHYCSMCHSSNPMIQLGAPKIKNSSDWKPRMQQGLKKLLQHTDEGLNAMPPRGGCFECTDKQLMLAILSMLP